MIGRKRISAASRIARHRVEAALAPPLEREVDHHDRVLLDDADQQQDADDRDDRQVHVEAFEREQRADAGRRQARENRDRVDVALVEHAEQDVDRQHRGEQQRALPGQRLLEQLRVAGEVGDDVCRAGWMLALQRVDRVDRLAERHVGREIERDRHRRLLRLAVDLQRPDGAPHRRDLVERHELAAGRGDADAAERVGVVLEILGRPPG